MLAVPCAARRAAGERGALLLSLLGRSALTPACSCYQGLHIDLGKLGEGRPRVREASSPSVEVWPGSASTSSESEQVSSLGEGEGAEAGRARPREASAAGASASLLGQGPRAGSAKMSAIKSGKPPSLRGMDSSRWLSSSAAVVASMPGQLETKVCTSCMHWM